MSEDLTAIATAAVAEAGLIDAPPDTTPVDSIETTTETTSDTKPPAEESKKEDKPSTEDIRTADELAEDKELEDIGLLPVKPGQKENRIPYSRVRKIILNGLKKRGATHAEAVKALNSTIEGLQTKVGLMDKLEEFVKTKPDEYIAHLQKLHPEQYGKYTKAELREAAKTGEFVPAKDDPKPEPDGEYPDGSKGYTPEGVQKLLEWNTRQAVRQAKSEAQAEMEKTLKEKLEPVNGILEERKAHQTLEQRRQSIKEATEEAREVWGDLFTQDEAKGNDSEIVKALNADSQRIADLNAPIIAFNRSVPENQRRPLHKRLPFLTIVAKVLLPKVVAERAKIREEVTKEVDEEAAKKRGASSSHQSTRTSGADLGDDASLEDIAMAAVKKAGLIK